MYEKSCGTIVINNDKVLLVKHNKGHIGFPKGHIEINETEYETAIRETKEETNVDVEIISDKRYIETYSPKPGVTKDVIYFIAKPISYELKNQESEVSDVMWVSINEVINYLTFDEIKKLWNEVLKDLNWM